MKKLMFLCLLGSCLPQRSKPESEILAPRFSILAQPAFQENSEESQLVVSARSPTTLKDLKNNILLIKEPSIKRAQHLKKNQSVPLIFKNIERGRLFSMRPKKNAMERGLHYGVYVREEENSDWNLKYVFYASRPLARIRRHDIGEESEHIVPKDRINFSFEFDQAIYLPDDQALSLLSKNGSVVGIVQLRISPDPAVLKITLEKNQLKEGQEYAFYFKRILNADGKNAVIEPLHFFVQSTSMPLRELAPLRFDIGHDSAEITWHLSNDHYADLYFGVDQGDLHDCLGKRCPLVVPVMRTNILKTQASYYQRIYLTGLKPKSVYSYVIRAEDHQGQILMATGVINTRAQSSALRFSEILINPKTRNSSQESKAEFLELVYYGEHAQVFNDLRLVMQDAKSAVEQSCEIASTEKPLALKPGQRVVLVGYVFDDQASKVAEDALIIRLAQKNLCGGLGNNKPKIIKLFSENSLIDRYGGYLWAAPEGRSIVRRTPEGLDELDNYCYCDEAKGPTPGGPP